MKCKNVIKLLPDFIHQKITGDRYEGIQQHLDQCDSCNKIHRNLLLSLDLLKPTKEIPEQAFYYTRLRQRMINRQETANTFGIFSIKKILQPAIYLTSILLAVYVGILIGSHSSGSNQLSSYEMSEEGYIELFTESQYLNDFELETIESTYFITDTIKE